jgi:hypothetical protein
LLTGRSNDVRWHLTQRLHAAGKRTFSAPLVMPAVTNAARARLRRAKEALAALQAAVHDHTHASAAGAHTWEQKAASASRFQQLVRVCTLLPIELTASVCSCGAGCCYADER